jgi:hypothetical protein
MDIFGENIDCCDDEDIITNSTGDNTIDLTSPNIDLQTTGNVLINGVPLAQGTGDVVGPASALDGNIATFDGISGKLIKDQGVSLTSITDDLDTAQIQITDLETKTQYQSAGGNVTTFVSQIHSGIVRPLVDNLYDLGIPTSRWKKVLAYDIDTSTITSDTLTENIAVNRISNITANKTETIGANNVINITASHINTASSHQFNGAISSDRTVVQITGPQQLATKAYVDSTTFQKIHDDALALPLANPVEITYVAPTTNREFLITSSTAEQILTAKDIGGVEINTLSIGTSGAVATPSITSLTGGDLFETVDNNRVSTITGTSTTTAVSHNFIGDVGIVGGNLSCNGIVSVGAGASLTLEKVGNAYEITTPGDLLISADGNGQAKMITLSTDTIERVVIDDDSDPVIQMKATTGIENFLQLSDIATPPNGLDTTGRLYKKTGDDGLFWLPDSAGTEVDLTVGGGGTNQALIWAIQGVLDNYSTLTSVVAVPLTSLVDGSASTTYSGGLALEEYGTSNRSGDIITIPSTGWYSIKFNYQHPTNAIIGGNVQAGLGADCKVFLSLNGGNVMPFGSEDSAAGVSESNAVVMDRYLTSGTTIRFYWDFGSVQTNEDFVISASLTNTQYINSNAPVFTGATLTTAGTTGDVPQPTAGDHWKVLTGNGLWTTPDFATIFGINGTVLLDYQANINPSTAGITLNGGTSWQTIQNNYFILLLDGGSQNRNISFNPGNYQNFRFEVYYKILDTTQPADRLGFFCNGTVANPPNESGTGGLVFSTDYFDGGAHNYKYYLDIGATPVVSGVLTTIDDINNTYNKFTITKIGSDIEVEITNDFFGRMKYGFNSTLTTAGTFWGIVGRTGGNSMNVEIRSIKLTVLN